MKKLIILLTLVFFVAVSCQKEDIRPNSTVNSCDLCEDDYSKSAGNQDGGASSSGDDDGTGGPITDPNNDEDEDRKKKKK